MLKNLLGKPLLKTIFYTFCLLALNESFANEKTNKQTREISNFSHIVIAGGSQLFLKQGNQDALTIEADPETLAKIDSTVTKAVLYLGPKKNIHNIDKTVTYYLTVKNIESVKSSGGIRIVSQGKITGDKLNIVLDGSGTVDIKIKVNELNNTINGAGDIKIQGNAKSQKITIAGSGVFQGDKLATDSTTISISGSGTAKIKAKDELNVKIEGYGKVQYYGNPKITQEISGAGEIIPLG